MRIARLCREAQLVQAGEDPLLGLGVADPVGCPKGIPHDVSYVAGDPRALDDSEAAAWQATGEELLERL